MLQLSGNNNQPKRPTRVWWISRKVMPRILDRIDLPTEDARRLMELGFVPGTRIIAGFSAPAAIRASSRSMVRKSRYAVTPRAA